MAVNVLTFKTVCLWSVQTAVIAVSSINWLDFTVETKCVYCGVGTESLNIIQVNVCLQVVNSMS